MGLPWHILLFQGVVVCWYHAILSAYFPLFITTTYSQNMLERDKRRTSYLQACWSAILTLIVKVSVYHSCAVTSACPTAYMSHPAATQKGYLNHRITKLSGGSQVALVGSRVNLNKHRPFQIHKWFKTKHLSFEHTFNKHILRSYSGPYTICEITREPEK